jgi:RNA polymerase sigma-70 factor (ECF subfamily)
MIEPSPDGGLACAFAAGARPQLAGTTANAGNAAIAAAFAEHRPDAIEVAYRAYGGSLYAVACRILHDPDEAEDCVHDALLRAWQRPNAYRPERGALRPFLTACVRNEALTRLRRGARHRRIEQRVARDEHVSYEFVSYDPIVRDRLRGALASLPPEQLAVLSLTYVGNFSQTEIASRLGIPLGTVKSRISLGLRKLAALVPQPESA